jgi:hypothetical protein
VLEQAPCQGDGRGYAVLLGQGFHGAVDDSADVEGDAVGGFRGAQGVALGDEARVEIVQVLLEQLGDENFVQAWGLCRHLRSGHYGGNGPTRLPATLTSRMSSLARPLAVP